MCVVSGPVIQLIGGSYFNFLRPAESEFFIEDIAHSLSMLCRFTGHTTHFYSVAQHSVGVSDIIPYPLAMYGLLHEVAEAFLNDISTPLKALLPEYVALEHSIETAVLDRFGIPRSYYTPHKLPSVRLADLTMLATEKRDLLPMSDHEWGVLDGIKPLFPTIVPLSPPDAKKAFLDRFYYLLGRAA